MYALGIDLGTTFTAAAVWRDGRSEISALGSRSAAIPSVVVLREDETIITGESANRRALTAPHRVAREFKRRLGDTTPILLGGVPYSAEALMSRVLQAVVEEVSTREGGRPDLVCVSHPANWGAYKTDLLHQAIRGADLENVRLTTEPEAAAAFYARQQRIPEGAVVAVYDLGGGTFDAAVLRKTAAGFEILGRPEGIERLGGIDFDAAVFAHVSRALGGALAELDDEDPATIAAVGRLKEECTEAKEALSSDTDTTIPVLLPNLTTEVRLTRAELEAMVRPALQDSIDAMRRALRSAQITPEELHSVLLVGGSSRMPLVSQLVGAEFGRPVAVDVHPKHAVALGAALLAAGVGAEPVEPPGSKPAEAQPAGSELAGAGSGEPDPGESEPRPPTPVDPGSGRSKPLRSDPLRPVVGRSEQVQPEVMRSDNIPPTEVSAPPVRPSRTPVEARRFEETEVISAVPAGGQPPPARPEQAFLRDVGHRSADPPAGTGMPRRMKQVPEPGRDRLALLAAGVAVLVIVLSVGWILISKGDDTNSPSAKSSAAAVPPLPPDERCTPAIRANKRWVCLTTAVFDGTRLTVHYVAWYAGSKPDKVYGYHLHFYGGDGVNPPASIEGSQAKNHGEWYLEDKEPSVVLASSKDYTNAIGNQPKVCARMANSSHGLVKDTEGGYETGNCIPIERK